MIGLRLKEIIVALKMRQKDFALKANTSEINISNIVTQKVNPSSETLEAICKAYPEINVRWLLIGEGNMFNNVDSLPNDLIELKSKYNEVTNKYNEVATENLKLKDQLLNLYQNYINNPSFAVK